MADKLYTREQIVRKLEQLQHRAIQDALFCDEKHDTWKQGIVLGLSKAISAFTKKGKP